MALRPAARSAGTIRLSVGLLAPAAAKNTARAGKADASLIPLVSTVLALGPTTAMPVDAWNGSLSRSLLSLASPWLPLVFFAAPEPCSLSLRRPRRSPGLPVLPSHVPPRLSIPTPFIATTAPFCHAHVTFLFVSAISLLSSNTITSNQQNNISPQAFPPNPILNRVSSPLDHFATILTNSP